MYDSSCRDLLPEDLFGLVLSLSQFLLDRRKEKPKLTVAGYFLPESNSWCLVSHRICLFHMPWILCDDSKSKMEAVTAVFSDRQLRTEVSHALKSDRLYRLSDRWPRASHDVPLNLKIGICRGGAEPGSWSVLATSRSGHCFCHHQRKNPNAVQ